MRGWKASCLLGNYEMQCRRGEGIRLHMNIAKHRASRPNVCECEGRRCAQPRFGRSVEEGLLSLERRDLRISCTYYVDKRAVIWVIARGFTCGATAIPSTGNTRMLEGLTMACRKTMPQLNCNVGRRNGNFYGIVLTREQSSGTSQVEDPHLPSGHCISSCSGSSQGTITPRHCSVQRSSI